MTPHAYVEGSTSETVTEDQDGYAISHWAAMLNNEGPMSTWSLFLSSAIAIASLTVAAVGANPYFTKPNFIIPMLVIIHHVFVAVVFTDRIGFTEVAGRVVGTTVRPLLQSASRLRKRAVVLALLATKVVLVVGSVCSAVMSFERSSQGTRRMCWVTYNDHGMSFFDCWDDSSVVAQAVLQLIQAVFLSAALGFKAAGLRREHKRGLGSM
jgi:hypothetical protein